MAHSHFYFNAIEAGVSGIISFSTGTTSSGSSGAVSFASGTSAGGKGGDISIVVGEGNTAAGGDISLLLVQVRVQRAAACIHLGRAVVHLVEPWFCRL